MSSITVNDRLNQQKLAAHLANVDEENSSPELNARYEDQAGGNIGPGGVPTSSSTTTGGGGGTQHQNIIDPNASIAAPGHRDGSNVLLKDRELKNAQSQRAIITFIVLLAFFIGVSVVIHVGDDRSLFHFRVDKEYVTMYLKGICYCNLTSTAINDDYQVCKEFASHWRKDDTYIHEINGTEVYRCVLLKESRKDICHDMAQRTHATHTMIMCLFGTFVIINVVAVAIIIITFLRQILMGLKRTTRLLRFISSCFGPSLVCAICFIPFAVIVGLAAAGILVTLFLDTMCRDQPESFFVRPALARRDFGVGEGAIFILSGTFSGFLVLVGGTIWTVNSRKRLSEMHAKKLEEARQQYESKQQNLLSSSNPHDYEEQGPTRGASYLGDESFGNVPKSSTNKKYDSMV